MAGGGGGGSPQAVAPTVNTSTVQHTNPTLDPTQGTTGGKGGGGGQANFQDPSQGGGFYNPLSTPSQLYGTASSPFGFNYGDQQASNLFAGTGGTQQNQNQWSGQNTFNPNEFSQSQQSLQGGGGNDAVDLTGGATSVDTLGGGSLQADNGFEAGLANNIAGNIAAGGINPETGQPNVSAGPNVLSAADEGFFGYGEDYNSEFQENYNAQSDHAANNPTGQSTGTPLYEQGYVEPGSMADTLVNNSTIGTIGNALTGENLLQTTDDLLPPSAAFNNSSNDNDNSWQNDGDATNDQGNAGWGFTSVADMFDGGGAGQSGDSYTGGIHGDNTVGNVAQGPLSIVSNNDNDDNDSGGGGGGGK